MVQKHWECRGRVRCGRTSLRGWTVFFGHPLGGRLWKRTLEEVTFESGREKYQHGNAFMCTKSSDHRFMWTTNKWMERSRTWVTCGKTNKNRPRRSNAIDRSSVFLAGRTERQRLIPKQVQSKTDLFKKSTMTREADEKDQSKEKYTLEKITAWSCGMEGRAEKCVERPSR